MKTKIFANVIGIAVLGLALSAQAHDPKEHMKGMEIPNCAPMKNMDHSKMDMSDPVTQAMMEKCMGDMQADESDKSESQNNEPQNKEQSDDERSGDQHSGHQH